MVMVRKKSKPVEKHDTHHMFRTLMWDKRSGCDVIMPNVHVGHWNECDALLVLKSGYTHEVEMKLSRSDFRADFKKTNWWHQVPDDRSWASEGSLRPVEENKHVLLERGQGFPNRFSFLVPEGLVTPDEVPPYAGLMYFTRNEGEYGRIRVERQAKLLHKTKITPERLARLTKKFVWRYNDRIEPTLETMYQYCCPTEEHF